MDTVKSYILEQLANRNITKEQAKVMLLELTSEQYGKTQNIAIIGLAGRFSEAKNVDEFWEFLKLKKNTIRDFPQSRKEDLIPILRNPYYTELVLGKSVEEKDFDNLFSKSGYLDEIDKFDAGFFGISPLEADYMDPNQRIALEVAWEAIENAGYGGNCLKGTKTGVYMGREHTNYSYYKMCSENHSMQLTGSWEGMVASRISYWLDLKGPCIVTDTACSSGMVSVHQAILSLMAGECETALAGGINLSTTGDENAGFQEGASMSSVESADSTIRTFDGRANGTLWGEGVGIVLLKPLNQAIEDGDSIRAIVKATAINNDGTSNSITAPNAVTQEQVILEAWNKAGIDPETISYVEAHGTGTVLGDPIEIKGLTNAFKKYTNRKQFCAIGSLKTTMGHLVAASGMASLAKVVKSLETKTIAPIANFEIPNPYINFTDSPFYVNDALVPWDTSVGVRRAVINSFGFIRTNCHMVLEEGIPYQSEGAGKQAYCLTISAKCENAIREYVDRYIAFMEKNVWDLKDICYTSSLGRGHYEYRILLIASTKEELANKLCWIKEHELITVEQKGIYFGFHTLVSEKKAFLEQGDLTAKMKQSSSKVAMAHLKEYLVNQKEQDLIHVARLYVQGAEIEWKEYYKDEIGKRVQIPTYPLQKIRHWAKPMITKVKKVEENRLHPLVHKKTGSKDGNTVFESVLTVEDWVLSDHKIEHKSVIPGTTYLEMIRYAFCNVTGKSRMEFRNVFFLQPLFVEEATDQLIKLQLNQNQNQTDYTFQVLSEKDTQWTAHVEGTVRILEDESPRKHLDIETLKRNATDYMDPYVGEQDTGVFQFGRHWDVVRAIWEKEDATLARMELPGDLKEESSIFKLHPSMLDNAVNLISQNTENTYLPYMYKSIKLYDNMPDEIYTCIEKKKEQESNGETMTYHISLVDREGNVFAAVSDYTVKKLDLSAFHLEEEMKYLTMDWCLTDEKAEEESGRIHWVTVVHHNTKGQEFVAALETKGLEVSGFLLESEELDEIFAELKSKEDCGLIWALDYTADRSMKGSYRRRMGVDALFAFYKGLIKNRIKLSAGIKILVKNAWRADKNEEFVDAFSAATASLAKVIKKETGNLNLNIIDAGNDMPLNEVVNACVVSYQTVTRALRKSGTFVEIMNTRNIRKRKSYEYKKDGVYVIAGGLGGIGFEIARKLAAVPVKKVILLGRTEINEEGKRKIDRLGKAEYYPCDIRKEEDIKALNEYIRAQGVTCDGVFHAAGISAAGYLVNKTKEYFDDVVAPKIDGTIHLYSLIEENPEALFVLFSSITAITCEDGQADYCCANAFLDSFACELSLEGRKAVAINWPVWEEVGMAARLGITSEEYIFYSMPVKEGLIWMDHFAETLENRVIPTQFRYKNLMEYQKYLPFMLSKDMREEMLKEGTQDGQVEVKQREVKLTGSTESSETELVVGNMFANVLGLDEIDIFASFSELGGNSLMITQLLKEVDARYPDTVDIGDLYSYSSISELASYIDEKTISEEKEDTNADTNAHQALEDVLKELGSSELLDVFRSEHLEDENDE